MEFEAKIAEHKRGDTWNGMSFLCEELQEDGSHLPLDLTGVKVLIQFKTSNNGNPIFEFKTDDGTITIPEPLAGEIIMMPRIIDVYPNKYIFDIQLTYPNGIVETIVSGSWVIINDVSR